MTPFLRYLTVIVMMLGSLPEGGRCDQPRVKVITHNLAGAFCKILTDNQSGATLSAKTELIKEMISIYKNLVDSDISGAINVVLFHFQEVCEASAKIGHLFALQDIQENSKKVILTAIRSSFSDWQCGQLSSESNFSSYVCAKPFGAFNEVKITRPSVENQLTNALNSKAMDSIARELDGLINIVKTSIGGVTTTASKLFKSLGSSSGSKPFGENTPEIKSLLSTKGSLISRFQIRWSNPNNVNIRPAVLSIVSANVHFSARNSDDRMKQLEETYKLLAYYQNGYEADAIQNNTNDQYLFSYVAGDFNSRVFKVKGNSLKVSLSKTLNDGLNVKDLALCLLLQRKINQSFYARLVSKFENDPNSIQGKYYSKCKPIYKAFLGNHEEYRKNLVTTKVRKVWTKILSSLTKTTVGSTPFERLTEAEFDGLILPSFAYNIYSQSLRDRVDYLTGTLNDLWAGLESDRNIQKDLNKSAYKTLMNYIPTSARRTSNESWNDYNIRAKELMKELQLEELLGKEVDELSDFFESEESNPSIEQNMNMLSGMMQVSTTKGMGYLNSMGNKLPTQSDNTYSEPKQPFSTTSHNNFGSGNNEYMNRKTHLNGPREYQGNSIGPNYSNINSSQQSSLLSDSNTGSSDFRLEKALLEFAIRLEKKAHSTPAWCDRLMYLQKEGYSPVLSVIKYQAHHDIRFSDHVPVSFSATINPLSMISPISQPFGYLHSGADEETKSENHKITFNDIKNFMQSIFSRRMRLVI